MNQQDPNSDPEPRSAQHLRSALVHIFDDDASFLTATEGRLRCAGYAIATYNSSQHLLDYLPRESAPGCLLLSAQMPGLGGLVLQSRLSELGATLPIVFVADYPDIPATVAAIKAGALDFLIKPITSKQLLEVVERAIAQHDAARDLKIKSDVAHARLAALTPRQRQVFDLIVSGNTGKRASCALGCTERTIKAHRHMVMKKMQVQSVAHLVSFAERSLSR
ncbi:FixJ family two-component response regulator [Bradyrhizobium sp. I1.8.5]|uniref:response regulator transcription factor n=1 Tax=unclassified Bradyrhizobium TaxID=2631580 RepID=UPI0033911EA2